MINAFKPGLALGEFTLVSMLGTGAYAEVWEAIRNGHPRALKFLTLDLPVAELAKQANEEARRIAAIRHPNVVSVYGSGVASAGDAEYVYIEMELCDAGANGTGHLKARTLAEIVEADEPDAERRFDAQSPRRVASILKSICLGVHECHENEILHGDLKPQNVLLQANGVPKVLDFNRGFATDPYEVRRAESGLTPNSALTPEFASPEQARGEDLTALCDVYAIGAIGHYLLNSGAKLYEPRPGATNARADVLDQKKEGLPPNTLGRFRRGKSGQGLWRVVRRGFELRPDRRYRTAKEFADAIDRWERSAAEPEDGFTRHVVAHLKREGAWYGTVVLAALLILVATTSLRGISQVQTEMDAVRGESVELRAELNVLRSEATAYSEKFNALEQRLEDLAAAEAAATEKLALIATRISGSEDTNIALLQQVGEVELKTRAAIAKAGELRSDVRKVEEALAGIEGGISSLARTEDLEPFVDRDALEGRVAGFATAADVQRILAAQGSVPSSPEFDFEPGVPRNRRLPQRSGAEIQPSP